MLMHTFYNLSYSYFLQFILFIDKKPYFVYNVHKISIFKGGKNYDTYKMV